MKPGDENLDEEIYYVSCFSPGYASPILQNAVKKQLPLSKRQLLLEDKYQLMITLTVMNRIF
jgi:hypothetical protein